MRFIVWGGGGRPCTVRSKLKKFEHIWGWIPIHRCTETFPPCEENGRQICKAVMKIRQVTVAFAFCLGRCELSLTDFTDIMAGRVHQEMEQQLEEVGKTEERGTGEWGCIRWGRPDSMIRDKSIRSRRPRALRCVMSQEKKLN